MYCRAKLAEEILCGRQGGTGTNLTHRGEGLSNCQAAAFLPCGIKLPSSFFRTRERAKKPDTK